MQGDQSMDLLGQDHEKYKKVKEIFHGTIGFTQLCKNKQKNDELVVIQFIQRGNSITEQMAQQILTLRSLNHPHVLKFIEAFLIDNHLAIVMEFASGGELEKYVVERENLSEDEARKFFQQLICGVDYCHQMGVKNKELKLENILLAESGSSFPLLKLCCSKYEMIRCTPKSWDVMPRHVAPEVINNADYDRMVADVWSCGVMLYLMLVGSHPFERPEDRQDPLKIRKMMTRIRDLDYQIPENLSLSSDCHDILQKILVREPEKRITIQQIYQHPWLKQGGSRHDEQENNFNSFELDDWVVVPPPDQGSVQSREKLKEILDTARNFTEKQRSLGFSELVDSSIEIEGFEEDQFEEEENLHRKCSSMRISA